MARGRTLVEARMETFDEADFCPCIHPMRHVYFMKTEETPEGIVLLLVIMNKNWRSPLQSLSTCVALW
jgi:hypothetical protein